MISRRCHLLLFVAVSQLALQVTAFSPNANCLDLSNLKSSKTSIFTQSIDQESGNSEVVFANIQTEVLQAYPNAEFVALELAEHKPLGCTVEESMDTESDPEVVFVSKVVEGGSADKAGIQVGDVLVGVTGMFKEVVPSLRSGVDTIKGLVAAVPDDEPLVIQIARETGVLERHEAFVVEICQSPGASDKEVEECVVNFIAAGYENVNIEVSEVDDNDVEDTDSDSMLDSMMNLWSDEFSLPPTSSDDASMGDSEEASKAKPWSARSSPSGTFVRDPVTGEMKNIDA